MGPSLTVSSVPGLQGRKGDRPEFERAAVAAVAGAVRWPLITGHELYKLIDSHESVLPRSVSFEENATETPLKPRL